MPSFTRSWRDGPAWRVVMALAVAAALAWSLVASAVPAAADDKPEGTPAPPVPRLAWVPCGGGLECATASVPLDYTNPHGRKIKLALARLPAADRAHRVGSLFFNPGGPGGPAIPVLQAFGAGFLPAGVNNRFDIVAVDPRGVGASTPVQCFDTPEQAVAFHADDIVFPTTPEEEQAVAEKSVALAEQCWNRQGWLLRHLSTANVARDFDLLRQAVGDEQISYVGYSYGTYVGATYANLFPDNVRSLVLDGAVDPSVYGGPLDEGPLPFTRINSHVASAEVLQAFFDKCVEAGAACSFGADGDPRAKFDELLKRVDATPIPIVGPDGAAILIGYDELIGGVIQSLYAPLWTPLADVLQQLYDATDAGQAAAASAASKRSAAKLLRLATDANPSAPGLTMAAEPQVAIICADADTPDDPFAWPEIAAEAEQEAPYAGEFWTYVSQQPCAAWPERDPNRYLGPWDAKTANPALVIGNTLDPATAYDNARILEKLMPGSRLLTLDGVGHTSIGQSTCVNEAMAAYLASGALPEEGAVCEPDFGPFDPLPTPPDV